MKTSILNAIGTSTKEARIFLGSIFQEDLSISKILLYARFGIHLIFDYGMIVK